MTHVIHPQTLVAEGILTEAQAKIIIERSRDTMITLVVNVVLCAGILSAALGLVFAIAEALPVAILGLAFLAVGALILTKGNVLYRMIGHAAALIGLGMLLSGLAFELTDMLEDVAGPLLLTLGAALSAGCAYFYRKVDAVRFSAGAGLVMSAALHLFGLYGTLELVDAGSGMISVAMLYAAIAIAALGYWLDVRALTALAIVPFAQILETGTAYFHAAYVFYSPEPTLTILQMLALILACIWAAQSAQDRLARHLWITAIMAAVVSNLAFLVGSLWGDEPGITFFAGPEKSADMTWSAYYALREDWRQGFLHISEHVFSVIWAIGLLIAAIWAAHKTNRGLFNTTVTFGAIHGYTQIFESLEADPIAFAILGLTAVPAAWALWRWNAKLTASAANEE